MLRRFYSGFDSETPLRSGFTSFAKPVSVLKWIPQIHWNGSETGFGFDKWIMPLARDLTRFTLHGSLKLLTDTSKL